MSCQSSPQTLGDQSSYLDTSAGSRAGGALPTLRGVWEESAQLGWNVASLCDCGGTMGQGERVLWLEKGCFAHRNVFHSKRLR